MSPYLTIFLEASQPEYYSPFLKTRKRSSPICVLLKARLEASHSIQGSLSESWILELEETTQDWKHSWSWRGDKTLHLLAPAVSSTRVTSPSPGNFTLPQVEV